MRFCSLGSGSGGNSTLIEASQGITHTRLLVDAGFSMRELVRRLARAGCDPEHVDAVFVTHEHGDHVGCALTFAARYGLPLVTSRGTWRAVAQPDFDPKLLRLVRDGEPMQLGDMTRRSRCNSPSTMVQTPWASSPTSAAPPKAWPPRWPTAGPCCWNATTTRTCSGPGATPRH